MLLRLDTVVKLKQYLVWAIASLCLLLSVIFTPAATANPVQTPNVQIQLISEQQGIEPGKAFWVGLHFNIRDGWHTYWRNPGDSGTAPSATWTLPPEFEAGELVYPYPKRLPAGPLLNFGYEGSVTLLTQITPPAQLAAKELVPLQVKADWLVCQVDCIPETATLRLTLPVAPDSPAPTQWAKEFDQTRRNLPKPAPWKATATVNDESLLLRVEMPSLQPNQIQQAEFFPDQDGIITNVSPQTLTVDDRGLQLRIDRGNLAAFDRVSGLLVLQEQLQSQTVTQAFTINAPVNANPSPTETPVPSALPLWQVGILALIGGMILNLMPCVFPVLCLKAFNIVQRSTESPRQIRLGAIVFTAGVLLSFASVAGTLISLRALGQQIGWGFQLQSPGFVLFMAYLMFAVALSLSGVFIFGGSLMGMGQRLTHRSGYVGEFFTGVFATVIATPCTAPFMATAIGVALTQPPLVAIAIFLLLGLGLALPYLMLSFIPAVHRLMPKPGAWMETFSQLLAFPMYGATAWLVWVLTQQTGTTGLAIAATGLILIAFAAWLHQKTRLTARWGQRLGTVLSLAVIVFALTLTQLPTPIASSTTSTTSKELWQPYAAETVANLRQAGQPVFVNFTAAWCITCQVNEQLVFSRPETIAAFQAKNVALLKADWTNQDASITQALETFERSGVPLYVLYPASTTAQPMILPQVLSYNDVQAAINQV